MVPRSWQQLQALSASQISCIKGYLCKGVHVLDGFDPELQGKSIRFKVTIAPQDPDAGRLPSHVVPGRDLVGDTQALDPFSLGGWEVIRTMAQLRY